MKILIKVKNGVSWEKFEIDTEIIKEKMVQTTTTDDGWQVIAQEVYYK